MARTKLAWLDVGPYPVDVGFTTSRAIYEKEIFRLSKTRSEGGPCMGQTWSAVNDENGQGVSLVFVTRPAGKRAERAESIRVVTTIVHECVHVWQHLKRVTGMHRPDDETEAYHIDDLVRQALIAYAEGY